MYAFSLYNANTDTNHYQWSLESTNYSFYYCILVFKLDKNRFKTFINRILMIHLLYLDIKILVRNLIHLVLFFYYYFKFGIFITKLKCTICFYLYNMRQYSLDDSHIQDQIAIRQRTRLSLFSHPLFCLSDFFCYFIFSHLLYVAS